MIYLSAMQIYACNQYSYTLYGGPSTIFTKKMLIRNRSKAKLKVEEGQLIVTTDDQGCLSTFDIELAQAMDMLFITFPSAK